jgi:hypothetical protein
MTEEIDWFLFTKRAAAAINELNAWLLDQCILLRQSEQASGAGPKGRSRRSSRPSARSSCRAVPVDGFRATQASVSKTCLVRQLRQSGARLADQIG